MSVLNLQLHALIRDVHTTAQAEGQGVLQLHELALLLLAVQRLHLHRVVELRHRALEQLAVTQVQLTRVGEHVHPAVAPRGQVVLVCVAQPRDHHRGIAAHGVRCLRVSGQAGTGDGLRGVELETCIQLGEGGLHGELEGLVIQRTDNVAALENVVVLLAEGLHALRAENQHVADFAGQLIAHAQQGGALVHVGALEGLVLDAQLTVEGPLAAILGGVHDHGAGQILTLSTDDHPPFTVTLKNVRVAVVRGVALRGAGNQRGQLTGRLRILTRGSKNLVGFAVAFFVLHVTGVEELKTAGNLNAGAGVAAVRIVAAIGNQRGTLIGPVSQVLTDGVAPVDHTLRVQGRVLVEGVVALTVEDQAVRVVQTAHGRCQVQSRVVAVFTNTGTESVQNLLCFSRQVAGGSLGCALLLFLLLAHVYPLSCKGMSGLSHPIIRHLSPIAGLQERGTTVLSASLIRGTGRPQRLIPPPADYVAHAPFATGEKSGHDEAPNLPQSSYRSRCGAVKCREAAHPMDAPPA